MSISPIGGGGIANNSYWFFAETTALNTQICVRGFRSIPAFEMTFDARPAINASYQLKPAINASRFGVSQAVSAGFDAYPAVTATIRLNDCTR